MSPTTQNKRDTHTHTHSCTLSLYMAAILAQLYQQYIGAKTVVCKPNKKREKQSRSNNIKTQTYHTTTTANSTNSNPGDSYSRLSMGNQGFERARIDVW